MSESHLVGHSDASAREAPMGALTRAAAWTMSVWLAGMSVWYVWTAIYAVRHPLNGGADRQWALLWLAYAAGAILLHVLLRRSLATSVWSVGLAALAVTMIVLSGRLLAALACLWLVLLAGLLGARLLRALRATPSDIPFEWSSVAFSTGLVLLSLAALALGLLRLLSPTGVAVLCAALSALEWRRVRDGARRLPRLLSGARLSFEQSLLAALCGFVALMNLTWALAPEIMFDALNYHLAVPRDFLEAHRIMDLPYYWHSYFAQMMDVFFALCLALGGQIAAKLMMFAVGVVAALAVYAFGRAIFNARVGLWAAALFYATPMTAWLSSTTYIEIDIAFFLFVSLLAFLRWREKRENGWLWASGLAAGAAVGVKATALYGLPALGLVLLWELARAKSVSPLARIRSLAGFVAAALLSAAPWYVVRFVFTGNPFFPLLDRVFPSGRKLPPGFLVSNITGQGYGRETPFLALLKVPFLVAFRTNRFGEPFPAGALGVALVLLFPLGLCLLGRRRGSAAIALAVCAGYLAAWAFVSRGVRYYYPVVPLVAALAVAAVDRLSLERWRRNLHFGLLGAVLLAQVAEIPVQFWNIMDRIPVLVVLGLETPDRFLARALPAYSAVQFLNRVASPGDKILGDGVENTRFYLRPRLDSVIETWDLQREVMRAKGEKLAADLSGMGYRYILTYGAQPSDHARFPYMDRSFLDNFATLEFNARNGRVYRLGASRRAAAVENLLVNPGFETVDAADIALEWKMHSHAEARVARGPEEVHSGKAAIPLPSEEAVEQSLAVSGVGGRLCTLGGFLRAEGVPTSVLRVDWFDALGHRLDSCRERVHVSREWSWHHTDVTAPEGAVRAQVFVSAHGDGRVWVDDVFFGKGTAPNPPAR